MDFSKRKDEAAQQGPMVAIAPPAARPAARRQMMPAFVLLALSTGVLAVRLRTADWHLGWPGSEAQKTTRHSPPPIAASGHAAPPAVAVSIVPETHIEPQHSAVPEPAGGVVAVHVQSRADRVEETLAADETASASLPVNPQVDAALAWNDIAQAAAIKHEQRQTLEELKPVLRQVAENKTRRRALDERVVFHKQLDAILNRPGDPRHALRNLAGSEWNGPIRVGSGLELDMAISQEMRRAWIAQQRSRGVEERRILTGVAEALLLNSVRRDGPRSPEDALLRAAQELRSVPLDAVAIELPQQSIRNVPPPRSSAGSRQQRLPASDLISRRRG